MPAPILIVYCYVLPCKRASICFGSGRHLAKAPRHSQNCGSGRKMDLQRGFIPLLKIVAAPENLLSAIEDKKRRTNPHLSMPKLRLPAAGYYDLILEKEYSIK
jgi:hypothetical protein